MSTFIRLTLILGIGFEIAIAGMGAIFVFVTLREWWRDYRIAKRYRRMAEYRREGNKVRYPS